MEVCTEARVTRTSTLEVDDNEETACLVLVIVKAGNFLQQFHSVFVLAVGT